MLLRFPRISRRRASSAALVLLPVLSAAFAAAAGAQATAQGDPFQVNEWTPQGQSSPAVQMRPDGGFVVAWQSYNSPGDDQATAVLARLFDSGGSPVAGDFQVHQYTASYQEGPSLAVNGDGGFVVVWDGNDCDAGDDAWCIRARRFAADGLAASEEFQVNTYTTGFQHYSRVAGAASGAFVVVWESDSFADDNDHAVLAQRYDAAGEPIGGELQVNVTTGGGQFAADVAMADDGDFAVVWESESSSGDDDSWNSIQLRRFDADSGLFSAEIQVNSWTFDGQTQPAVALQASGELLVVWRSETSGGDDADRSIQGRLFDSGGAPVGDDFQVNTYTTGEQRQPRVVARPGGGFIVVWDSEGSPGDDQSSTSIQARRYRATGEPIGDQFQVNSLTSTEEVDAALAIDPRGDFVVAWESGGSTGTDDSSCSVQARRFDDVFRDGFEPGNWNRWSASQTP